MEKKILQFSDLLRRAGVRVTLAETIDALRGLSLVDFRREPFYIALRSTLIKDASFFLVFDKLFNFYFNDSFFAHDENKAKFKGLNSPARPALEEAGACCSGSDKSNGKQGGGRSGEPGMNFAHVIRVGTPAAAEEFLTEGLTSLGQLKEEHLFNRDEALREIKVYLEWKMGEYQLEKMACEADEETKLAWQDRINKMEADLRHKLEEALLARFGETALDEILKRTNLNQLEFYKLSNNQVVEIKKKLTKLAHKLAARVTMRREKSKRGEINLQRTIRKSMATGGVPISPAYQRRKPTKPEIFILCDLSGSVATFSEFLLQFVYSVQTRFISTRSFGFVDTVAELTTYFDGREVEEAIKDIYNRAVFSKTGFSNFGLVWKIFNQQFHNQLSRKTTLIILGDARNNYQPSEREELLRIRQAVKRVIWLNPEPMERWNKEDSIMSFYEGCCQEVHECRNLEQLERVIQKLF